MGLEWVRVRVRVKVGVGMSIRMGAIGLELWLGLEWVGVELGLGLGHCILSGTTAHKNTAYKNTAHKLPHKQQNNLPPTKIPNAIKLRCRLRQWLRPQSYQTN